MISLEFSCGTERRVCLESFFRCCLYNRPFFLLLLWQHPFAEQKQVKGGTHIWILMYGAVNECFQQQILKIFTFHVCRIFRYFFSSSQRSTACTRDPSLYSNLNIELAVSQQLFWWGLLNYCFVWMHSKVNWSLSTRKTLWSKDLSLVI